MSDILNFRPDKVIWVCECGCASFHLRNDGLAECCVCDSVPNGGTDGWYDRIKQDGFRCEEKERPIIDINGNGSVDFARHRAKHLAGKEDAVTVIVFSEDGSVHTWSIAETERQLEWFKERLSQADQMVSDHVRAFLNGKEGDQ